jgi:hypothetical protein
MKTNLILNTRSLEKRRAELQALQDALEQAQADVTEAIPDELTGLQEALDDARAEFGEDEAAELKELDELESEVPEWRHGATLIHYDQFLDYCKELLEGLGELPHNLPDYIVIDWGTTIDNLKADYSECEYQGETYLYRNC